jgi:hypothetical protein
MTSLTDALVDGIDVKVGREVLTVPALNFKALRRLKPSLDILKGIDRNASDLTDEQFDAIVHIVHTAIRRNYPNMSIEDLEEGLDMSNLKPVIDAVMANSGMKPSGEARPGQK